MKTADEFLEAFLTEHGKYKSELSKQHLCLLMESYYEHRLLLSSEAEKGETAGFPESARRIAVALLTEVMNGMNESLQERITLFLQSQKVFFPSPPSPQEKQGVEEYEYEMFFDEGAGEFVQLQGWFPIAKNMIRHPERIEHYIERGLLRRITPAPAVPDKREEFDVPERSDKELIEMITTHRSLSVEKSEGEEADGILELNATPNHPKVEQAISIMKEYSVPVLKRAEIIALCRDAAKEKLESRDERKFKTDAEIKQMFYDAIYTSGISNFSQLSRIEDRMRLAERCLEIADQYSHSSGDRGRKEWPSDEEIEKWAHESAAPYKDYQLAKGHREIGAYWVINWLKTRSGK